MIDRRIIHNIVAWSLKIYPKLTHDHNKIDFKALEY